MYNTSFRSFSKMDWYNFQENIKNTIAHEISDCDDNYLLNVCENEYISYLADKYSFEPLVIHGETEEVDTPQKFREDMSQYHDYISARYGRYRDGYVIRISYLFSGDSQLFQIRPNPFTLTSYNIDVDRSAHKVSFTIRVYSQDVNEFQKEKTSAFDDAFCNVKNINSCVEQHNIGLRKLVSDLFHRAKEERLSRNKFFAAINVKKSTNSPATYGVPTIKRKEIVKPSCPYERQYCPEPSLDLTTYRNIIAEINQVGKSMERKPSLYLNKDEEGLRDVFVTMLETRFEGTTATGETFNHSGKTDILLKNAQDGTNLFIAECKFWHGSKHLHDAISQLFDRYLTWRDSKTALIVFVRGTEFSTVLESIKKNIALHDYYLRQNAHSSETSFSYIFRLPQDSRKEVLLEVMAFHFDKSKNE